MPNWCENKVTVTGSDEQLTAFKEYVSGKDHYDINSHLSFHQIIPMPNEIRNTRSPVKIYDTQEETDVANKEMDELFGDSKIGAMSKATHAKLLLEHGTDNWYDWANKSWGTKWQPSNIEFTDYGDYLEYAFDTAWGPPVGVYLALVGKFQEVDISWFYNEPDMELTGYLNESESVY